MSVLVLLEFVFEDDEEPTKLGEFHLEAVPSKGDKMEVHGGPFGSLENNDYQTIWMVVDEISWPQLDMDCDCASKDPATGVKSEAFRPSVLLVEHPMSVARRSKLCACRSPVAPLKMLESYGPGNEPIHSLDWDSCNKCGHLLPQRFRGKLRHEAGKKVKESPDE